MERGGVDGGAARRGHGRRRRRREKTYAGQEYDYVFDVDFKDGAPPLKLPFNDGDNPYAAAEQFLETPGLPMEYREQVVNFIVQNVGSANVAQGANVDPFTGAGAYVPGVSRPAAARSAPGAGYGVARSVPPGAAPRTVRSVRHNRRPRERVDVQVPPDANAGRVRDGQVRRDPPEALRVWRGGGRRG